MLLFFGTATAFGQIAINKLQVEYRTEPMGLDEHSPRFSWQMQAKGEDRGFAQRAFRIIVTNPSGETVWDSGKVENAVSLAIPYEGSALEPTTRYLWEVTVWDHDNKKHAAASWFETGLMDPDPDAAVWRDARWIGGGADELQLYSHYLSVFKLNYQLRIDKVSGSSRAAFIIGANDSRLMEKDLNIQGVASGRNGHYISFELDISEDSPSGEGKAMMNVYRQGYAMDDTPGKPLRSFEIPPALINEANKYEPHRVYLESNFGLFQVFLDGEDAAHLISESDDKSGSPFATPGFNLNPVGSGNNYISFPMLADIGFQLDAGQVAYFPGIEIRNYRQPSNLLFLEQPPGAANYEGVFSSLAKTEGSGLAIDEQGFRLEGGTDGVLITADPSRNATPMLRTTFETENKAINKARLYSTARGIYEFYVNGSRVGEDYFAPGLTQYNKTHQYQTYDVTALLEQGGENAMGAWLSEGWWGGNITYSGENWNYFGDRPSFRTLIVITYEDGSEQVLTTNTADWKLFTDGPLRYGSFFQGEVYDAGREHTIEGWANAGFDDSAWKQAGEVRLKGTTYQDDNLHYNDLNLISQLGESPSIVETLTARSVEEVRDGVYVYDMGQNMVGFPRIRIENGTKGDTLIMRYAEVRYPDLPAYEGQAGMIMLENIRAALTQDMYIMKGGGETIQPRFTFHGYRFLELSGLPEPLAVEEVQGRVVSSIKNLASRYETSNELVNKLWENIGWSLRGNFLSIPTDTPARNERMGWSGDINVFSEAATYLAHAAPFLSRHLLAMRDIQREDGRFTDVAPVGGGFGGTLWGSAGIVIPWEVYRQYGDKRMLEEHYEAMKRYMAFLDNKVDAKTGRLDEGPLGDWLSPEGSRNDNTLLWTAYQVYNLEVVSQVAEILGMAADAEAYLKRKDERKAYFNATYVDAQSHKTVHSGYEGRMFGPPPPDYKKPEAGDLVDTQASYAIPLNFDVFSEEHKLEAASHLANAVARQNRDDLGVLRPEYSLMTGFIGTASLSHALSESGRDAYAYRLLQQQTYPSWLYSVVNGATTIWERLNSYTIEDGFGGNNSMNSFNHYSFGAVAAWMYNHSLGIQRDEIHPGFSHFVLNPAPDPTRKMTWARGYYDSMYGRIKSAWELDGEATIYRVTVPPNTTATLNLKAKDPSEIREGGKPLKKAAGISLKGSGQGKVQMELVSGTYEFRVE
jgi:alpha-L-rhamnosidase